MLRRVLLFSLPALALAALAATAVVGPITFEEIAQRAGVHFVALNSASAAKEQPESMVAGVALFDYDGDGLLDIYFVNGGTMPGLVKDGPQFSNRLFHNNGNLTFTDVTEKAGLAGSGYDIGVAIGDYDNDGRPDIFVASLSGNKLYHNNGDGTFTDVTAKAGLGGATYAGKKMWSVAAAWLDYNNDGLLDLVVSNYTLWSPATDKRCSAAGVEYYCDPRLFY